jgi:hypothetical protein
VSEPASAGPGCSTPSSDGASQVPGRCAAPPPLFPLFFFLFYFFVLNK